jgi:hypothetical protein
MAFTYTVRPISTDEGLGAKRTPSAFKVTWSQTLAVLEREVGMLNGRNVVIELDVLPGQLTNAGQLRATSKVRGNAVRVLFDSKHGPLVYGTNEFVRGATSFWRDGDRHQTMQHDWQHNVYAIARSLEALRQVDRYGVSKRGQQYGGFAELPGGTGATPMGAEPAMTKDQALSILTNNAQGAGPTDGFSLEQLYRRAKARTHPDRHHGSQTLWDETAEVARVLGIES